MSQVSKSDGTVSARSVVGKSIRLMLLGVLLIVCSLIAKEQGYAAGDDQVYKLIFEIIYALAVLAGFAVMLFGLIKASGAEKGYQIAMWVEIGTLALSVLAIVLGYMMKDNRVPSSIIEAVSNVAGLATGYFIINTTNKILKRLDKPEAADYGRKTFLLLAIGILLYSILSVLVVVAGATWSKIVIAIFKVVARGAEVMALIRCIIYLDRARNIIS